MEKQWKRPENLFVLDAKQAALVIIDMQNFSCAPIDREPLPRIDRVIKQINLLADFCREVDIPVIWVRHNLTINGRLDNGGLFKLFHDNNHIDNTVNLDKGTDIYAAMHFDSIRDYVVFKNRYSAFLSDPPELQTTLKRLKKKQLIIAGIAANVCVESTLRDAMQLDYEVILLSDGTTATDDILLQSTLANTYQFFGDLCTAEDVINQLSPGETYSHH